MSSKILALLLMLLIMKRFASFMTCSITMRMITTTISPIINTAITIVRIMMTEQISILMSNWLNHFILLLLIRLRRSHYASINVMLKEGLRIKRFISKVTLLPQFIFKEFTMLFVLLLLLLIVVKFI